MVLTKLTISNLRGHRMRVMLTLAAIALSVSLVVAVTTGYNSTEAAAHKVLDQFLSGTDATITRSGEAGGIPESLVTDLQNDPAIQTATGRLETKSALIDAEGDRIGKRVVSVIGIRRPQDKRADAMEMDAGKWFTGADGDEVVIDQVLASQVLHVKVGDTMVLPGVGKQLKLKIVGIVHKPEAIALHFQQTLYVPLETLQRFTDQPGKITELELTFKPRADTEAFVARWREKLQDHAPPLKLVLAGDRRRELDKQLQSMHLLGYLSGAVSMLAAAFIVFSTLSMGVSERVRTLAMLRAVGMYRGQIGRLVLFEGIVLALCGALIGAPLGYVWMAALAAVPKFAFFFSAGVVVSWGGVAFGIGGSIVAALVAGFLPAWHAMRVSPLEAMGSMAVPPRSSIPLICAAAGLVLIALDPLLLFGPVEPLLRLIGTPNPLDATRTMRYYLHLIIGLPAMMIGFALLAPLVIWIVERTFGRLVALVMGLRFALLRQQLSGGMWRSAGTAAALMVGLATLVAMQTQGHTMLAGWKLPDHFPDIFIASPLSGLDSAEIEQLASVPGIKDGQLLPVALVSPEMGSGIGGFVALSIPTATLFFGAPPDLAFKMIELDFRQGNPAEARKLLEQGHHILITQEFATLKHVGVGDKFPLKTRNGIVDYTIAGVVWSPGLDVIVTMFDLGGQFEQRTASCVFGTLADARRDFGVTKVQLFAANVDTAPNVAHAASKEQIVADIQKAVGKWGLRVGDVREIKNKIITGFERLLLLTSTVAFAAMAVAALGVTNTIMAGIRSRRWQFGILRSIGVTRGQLLRLVLAEAALLGIVGCVLGLAAGLELSIDAKSFTFNAIGYNPPLTIPWAMIGVGVAVIMVMSILASVWPAVSAARSEPLSLLQAGRASA